LGWIIALAALALLAGQFWRGRQRQLAADAERARLQAEVEAQIAQVRREKEMLARDNQTKTEIVATLSREVRGHLNGIMGSADLLADEGLEPGRRAHLVTLRASAASLDQALNDVLDFARIESGEIQLAHLPFDLWAPLGQVVDTLSPLAALKEVELVLNIAPDVPRFLSGDCPRLRQVLLNLMSNALRFTTGNHVVLRVTQAEPGLVKVAPGAVALSFCVTERGIGMPQDLPAMLFNRTLAASKASPRNFGSAGLELAISQRLVELMGGAISARALAEAGSELCAVLTLPVEKESGSPYPADLKGLHVVVLDDQADARAAIANLLKRMRLSQDATDSVLQAGVALRYAVESGARELVLLLDDSMARARGEEVAALLGARTPLAATRVVLMTNDAANEPQVPGLALAATLRKPLLRFDTLWAALRPNLPLPRALGSRTPFAARSDGRPARVGEPRVLVVDDDNISRLISLQLLEILGCAVELAVSGPEAIARVRGNPFDLIFMDCQMPEMDGFETTRRIVAETRGAAPPIVALTANTSDRDREKCFEAGMSDFIGKPVHKADLALVLKRWIPTLRSRPI
jgi:two-component system, sensor histidine kinase and response regulator